MNQRSVNQRARNTDKSDRDSCHNVAVYSSLESKCSESTRQIFKSPLFQALNTIKRLFARLFDSLLVNIAPVADYLVTRVKIFPFESTPTNLSECNETRL